MYTLPFALAVLASSVQAQQTAWGQCGGTGWTGATTCVAGYTCTASSQYYSQCLPGTASSSSPSTTLKTVSKPATTVKPTSTAGPAPVTTAKPTTTAASAPSTPSGKLKYIGVDESCAEFGTAYPGTWGVDFTFPDTTAIDTLISKGHNIFRVPFMMERMAVASLTATLDPAYLANYTTVINHITSKGAKAVLDPHNYGRYKGAIITATADFQKFWSNLATAFKTNANVIFDTNNEYNSMDQSLVVSLNQAAINGIRGAGATTQTIYVEGNSWTGAASWNVTNDSMKTLTDPQNKLVYEMHLYLDSDASGTSPTCSSADIGVQRAVGATAWLKANGKQGIIGEFAGGANTVCLAAVTGLLNHLAANNDVWQGAVWWAAGPWWGTTTQYTFEPPTGTAYQYYNTLLTSYRA